MKKFIFLGALAIILTSGVAYAADVPGCTKSGAINYNSEATIDDGSCIFDANGNPNKVVNGWGLTNEQSKMVVAGTIVADQYGITSVCPKWQPVCVDISRTDYYVSSMKSLARQLIANGFSAKFPTFKGWYSAVR